MTQIFVTVWTPEGAGRRRELRQDPDLGGYSTLINGEYQGILWNPLPPDRTVPPLPADVRPAGSGGLEPREVALDILSRIPLPDIKIRANPGLGLVNLPGWYWVEGYNGASFGESRTVTIPPIVGAEVPTDVVPAGDPRRQATSFTVEVRVWADRYDWSFGDGAGLTTRSLGRPYPEESDIQHTYQHSSLPFASGFPVRLTVEFGAEYRIDGAGPFGLPSVARTYETTHRVQEIQPVLVAPPGTR
jgi:hypothetical protein